ncbi:Transcription elongation factor TFIIS/Cofactor of enhancer-binding protein Sp1 [Trachipleistophora hominis]|uniref:Transcription elongation factor TFIIS/Cofactor of enhancer-binding protein Sp1 n=1 Tax=Trachipleistophora hominis TaxID=72359 RepID=L7JZN5_TRAHO|nr:Transcription elongation factor TFIIS/Cofactor of enhancer-binding protein Sp1 [Trachipleistophora hominis]
MVQIASDQNTKKGEISTQEALSQFAKGDQSRDRTTSLFYEVFVSIINDVDKLRAARLASDLEQEIYDNKIVSSQIRSKYLNLKDKSNDLCVGIYEGRIGVHEFLLMSMDEMKSKARRSSDNDLIKSSIEGSQIAQMEVETDIFFCFKCKQRKCRYRQIQTRSADEPMTTYVFCKCGNTWKF